MHAKKKREFLVSFPHFSVSFESFTAGKHKTVSGAELFKYFSFV